MKNQSNAGRKAKYNPQEMLDALMRVAEEYPEARITEQFLSKHTDFPRHAWLAKSEIYRPVREAIALLQTKSSVDSIIPKAHSVSVTLLDDIRGANGDEKRIIKYCNQYSDTLRAVSQLASKQEKEINTLKETVQELKHKLQLAEEQSKHFEEAYAALYVDSQNPAIREKKSLTNPSNLIYYNRETIGTLDDDELLDAITNLKDTD